jgi:hypothetical protein
MSGLDRRQAHETGAESDRRRSDGPISYLIVEFRGSKMTGEGFSILVDLVDKGVIRILDLRFITKDFDSSVRALELADINRDGRFDGAMFDGVSSGLADEGDFADAASVIQPGSSAGILIFENRWATSFVDAEVAEDRESGLRGPSFGLLEATRVQVHWIARNVARKAGPSG